MTSSPSEHLSVSDLASIPTDLGEALRLVIEYLEANRNLIYVEIAVLTLLVANIIANFGDEVERIWKAKQSKITILYYIIRYFPPLGVVFALWCEMSTEIKYLSGGDACRAFWWLDALVCTMVVQALAEVLMVMRVWALYNFSKMMLFFIGIMVVCGSVVGVWAAANLVAGLALIPWPRELFPLPGCPTFAPKTTYAIQTVLAYNIITTTIIFLCVLNRCLTRDRREQPFLGTWRDLFGIQTAWTIVHVLIRDGCLYFLMVVCADLFLLVLLSTSQKVAFYIFPIIQAAYSIPATRLVLNLRDRSYNSSHQTSGSGPDSHIALSIQNSPISFAERDQISLSRGTQQSRFASPRPVLDHTREGPLHHEQHLDHEHHLDYEEHLNHEGRQTQLESEIFNWLEVPDALDRVSSEAAMNDDPRWRSRSRCDLDLESGRHEFEQPVTGSRSSPG